MGMKWCPNPSPQTAAYYCEADQLLYGGEAGGGKALARDTPIPTPGGWTDMGSLRVGDAIFDEVGHQCRVVAATGVMIGRPCFEVEFSDGAKIVPMKTIAGSRRPIASGARRRNIRRNGGPNGGHQGHRAGRGKGQIWLWRTLTRSLSDGSLGKSGPQARLLSRCWMGVGSTTPYRSLSRSNVLRWICRSILICWAHGWVMAQAGALG